MRKMKKFTIPALLLAVCLIFSGCTSILSRIPHLGGPSFSDMEYVRPDVAKMENDLEELCVLVKTSQGPEEVTDSFWEFYQQIRDFYTMMSLSNIHYYHDLTDLYWQKEYDYCTAQTGTVSAVQDTLFRAMAQSPVADDLEGEDYFGSGFFDEYQGESHYDEDFLALLDRESELISQYYRLAGEEDTDRELAQLYVDLVLARENIADCLGYDDYEQYAYEMEIGRDYTPEQTRSYTEEVREKMVPLYRQLPENSFMSSYYGKMDTFSYTRNMAEAMGGKIADCFEVMDGRDLYDITDSDNSMDQSFEIYLDSYLVPYVFVKTYGTAQDPLAFTHEFGHFCNDYYSMGSAASEDVSEVFSQAMEYMSLCYGNGPKEIRKLKMIDGLCVYVEQTAYNDFEQQIYGLPQEEVTVEKVTEIFDDVADAWGFSQWSREGFGFVDTPHFFISPFYVMSYVVSNDAAIQYFQMEQEQKGSGLENYLEHIDTEQTTFMAFLDEAGLESPFEPGRIDEVADLFAEELSLTR